MMHVDPVTDELEYTVRRCKLTMHYNASERRYLATLVLPDGSIERKDAEPPDGVARLLEWANSMVMNATGGNADAKAGN